MHGEDVLGQIDAYGYDAHGLPLPQNECVDERLDFPSWHFDAVSRNCAGRSGGGSPFHSFGVIAAALRHVSVFANIAHGV